MTLKLVKFKSAARCVHDRSVLLTMTSPTISGILQGHAWTPYVELNYFMVCIVYIRAGWGVEHLTLFYTDQNVPYKYHIPKSKLKALSNSYFSLFMFPINYQLFPVLINQDNNLFVFHLGYKMAENVRK